MSNRDKPFYGRTIHLVSDLSLHEQLYLYEKTRLLKDPKATPGALLRCNPTSSDAKSDASLYLMFSESSTRTKDSFRNAAVFHGMDVNDINDTRSLFKKETVTDVIKMLTSYSTKQSIFVIRSPMEGACRWLETALAKKKFNAPRPSFINAGDGRHTHPTLEFVDSFTLLEINNWDRASIHIALVGDLSNGRTAHSKVDGLKVFNSVKVDLIAPPEAKYPVEYRAKMEKQGFVVREFDSIAEYIDTCGDDLAKVWNFCRLQVSRIGEEAKGRVEELLNAITFREAWKSKLPEGARFFQTLPRDPQNPLIPLSFDDDEVNAWEQVSANGYWVRIVLLGMLSGLLGDDFCPQSPSPKELLPAVVASRSDFMREEAIHLEKSKKSSPIVPFAKGVVIDHVARGASRQQCWTTAEAARQVTGWINLPGTQGVYSLDEGKGYKAVLSMPDLLPEDVSDDVLKMLAALAPGCTYNVVADFAVVKKWRLRTPPRIFGYPKITCKNVSCISNVASNQPD
eukprot:gene20720-31926_t